MRFRLCAALLAAAAMMSVPASAQQAQPSGPAGSATSPAATPAKPQPSTKPQPATKPAPPVAQHFRTPDGDLDMTKVIGASVSNDQNQVIGTIDDVLLNKKNQADRVVLSVGGFLGVGSRSVQVPFAHLKIGGDKIILPGATKVSLENLSAYQAK